MLAPILAAAMAKANHDCGALDNKATGGRSLRVRACATATAMPCPSREHKQPDLPSPPRPLSAAVRSAQCAARSLTKTQA